MYISLTPKGDEQEAKVGGIGGENNEPAVVKVKTE